jgi:hypothetical protein
MSGVNDPYSQLETAGYDALPAWFVRLRDFFGKRLGAADFLDEQRYHAGKQRLHNLHLHGAGVLCGLEVSTFSSETSSAETTVLRVRRGAALDRCGREVVVGTDQCVDVASWYSQKKSDTWPDPNASAESTTIRVMVRYRECTTDPEPAPRDPCACPGGGSEYGRIREWFELALMTEEEAAPFLALDTQFPGAADLDKMLAGDDPWVLNGEELRTSIAAKVRAGHPTLAEPQDDWLCLAQVSLALDSELDLTGITVLPQPVPPVLFSGAVTQDLMLRLLAAGIESRALETGGPAVANAYLQAVSSSPSSKHYVVLELTGGIDPHTLNLSGSFSLSMLDDSNGWMPVTIHASFNQPPLDPMPTYAIVLELTQDQVLPLAKYRLALTTDLAEPIVDDALRPLRPLRFSWSFQVGASVPADGLIDVGPVPVGG